MLFTLCRFLVTLICFLPILASAATTRSIHVEWGYTPPSKPAVTGFKLYQEGVFACKTTIPTATGMDCTVSLIADTTNFTLTATFNDGTESPHSSPFPFTISRDTTTSTLPIAVVSSSKTTGTAPLTVTFTGTDSNASTSASLATYAWKFGDGTTATGANVSHTFTTVGTYTTTLTVTDSKGLTSSSSTPVIVTAATTTTAKAPTAVINATVLSGTVPLTVSLDGAASTDADGTIASYFWNFGDGSSASGKTVTHTYTSASTFIATLEVTDNQGLNNISTKTITVQPASPVVALHIEVGDVSVTNNWVRVPISGTFLNPIVVAGAPTFQNADPCTVRVRNISRTGFDIKLAEWNYQDGVHPAETVSYLVMEKGRTTLPNGSMVEAGSFTGTTSFNTVMLGSTFTKIPVVLTTVASFNETDTISGRIKSIGQYSFSYYFREQEKNTNTHLNEAVNFIAWEPGKGTIGSIQYEAATTANAVTNTWYRPTFQGLFKQQPLLLAAMQTNNETDTAALRTQYVTASGFQVKVEEETSLDTETAHLAEAVGYLAFDQLVEKQRATFSWDFDKAEEIDITGFQVFENGEAICTSTNVVARQLSCEITKPTEPTTYTVQAMFKTGGTSAPSNGITYTPE